MKNRILASTAAALAAVLTLAGCSTATSPEQAPAPTAPIETSDANLADVMFTTMMIPHHEQAVEMADMILAKSGIDDRVAALAEEIKAAQGPEILLMREWLAEWGTGIGTGMGGMDHGSGMMSGTDMDALDAATGAEASRMFLEQMVEHHEGAIDMSQAEVDNGQNPDVVNLAQQIIDAQVAEIAVMRDILSSL